MKNPVHNLWYHIVIGTADRRPTIVPGLREGLYGCFEAVVEQQGGVVIGVGGIPNHVHLLVRLPPTASVSKTVQALMAESTRWAGRSRNCDLAWGEGYGVFSVGKAQAPEVLRSFLHQESHHLRKSYAYELLALMNGRGAAEAGCRRGAVLAAEDSSGSSCRLGG